MTIQPVTSESVKLSTAPPGARDYPFPDEVCDCVGGITFDRSGCSHSAGTRSLSERHLRRTLTRYFVYDHRARTHLALQKDAPDVRPIERPEVGTVVQIPEVGGLHHRDVRRAA